MRKGQNERWFLQEEGTWGGGHTSLGPSPNLGLKWEESISLRKQAVNRAAMVSKKMSSKILPSSQNIGKLSGCGCGWVRLNLCGVSTRLPGVALDRAGQGLALSKKCSLCLKPKTRVSATRPPSPHPLLPDIPSLGQEARPQRPQKSSKKRLWLFGTREWRGRGEAQGEIEGCCPPFPIFTPLFPKDTGEISAGPGPASRLWGGLYPSWERGDGDGRRCGGNPSQQEGQNATETAQRWGREKG